MNFFNNAGERVVDGLREPYSWSVKQGHMLFEIIWLGGNFNYDFKPTLDNIMANLF